jgi:hypothetical protein
MNGTNTIRAYCAVCGETFSKEKYKCPKCGGPVLPFKTLIGDTAGRYHVEIPKIMILVLLLLTFALVACRTGQVLVAEGIENTSSLDEIEHSANTLKGLRYLDIFLFLIFGMALVVTFLSARTTRKKVI